MSTPVVKTSSRLWSQEVAEMRAATEIDCAAPGGAGIVALVDSREPGYEWSNGRKYATPLNPYA